MKKIFNILMCFAVAAFVASCSDDTDNPYAHTSSITIDQANVLLDAVASDAGRIVYSCNGNVTASTSASWAKTTISGDTVKVSVEQNDSRFSRSASVVLHHQADSVVVTLVQKGVTVNIEKDMLTAPTNNDTIVSCTFASNINLAVASQPDWVTTTFGNGKVNIHFTANNSGSFRRGVVYLRSANFTDSIEVGQYNFDADIKGTYKFTYYRDTTYTTTRTVNATVQDNTMRLSGFNLNLPYTFDEATMSFVVSSGDYVGRSGSNYYFLMTADENMNYWSGFNKGITISAPLTHDAEGNVEAAFRTNYSGIIYSTLLLGKFTANNYAQDSYNGLYQTLCRPVLTRQVNK